jgi:hypothetical protein
VAGRGFGLLSHLAAQKVLSQSNEECFANDSIEMQELSEQ